MDTSAGMELSELPYCPASEGDRGWYSEDASCTKLRSIQMIPRYSTTAEASSLHALGACEQGLLTVIISAQSLL